MVMENTELTKYERAKRKVAAIRGFYNHLGAYLVVNAVLLILKDKMTVTLLSKRALGNPELLAWIDWNIYGTPIIWGIILGVHAIKVFGGLSIFGRKWEERQLRKFMEEE
jgi:hypothetical protein